jgi:hypothetical protein
MNRNIASIFGLALFVILALGSTESSSTDSASTGYGTPGGESPSTPREVVYNSAWDGSVRQVKDYLKDQVLKDPDSYQSIEWSTVVKTSDGSFAVRHKFRAKNSFGGYVIENYIFTLDPQGNVTGAVDMDGE